MCSLCKVSIGGSKTHLERHEKSEQHKKSVNAAKNTVKISNFIEPNHELLITTDAAKKLEVRLCLFIAEHNLPFSIASHLVSCLKEDITDSKIIKKVSLNRIKAQKIIRCVTGPQNTKLISTTVNQEYFSLIIDESTDSTTSKNLATIIRYFDNKCRDRFLTLAQVSDCSALGIFETLINALLVHNINLKNLIGFTADNCSVMMGKHNGVQAKLKEIVPKLFVHGCICHNLNLISIAAASKLPIVIDKLIREINFYFCNCSSRKADFMTFQINFGTELHTILKYAATRRLSGQVKILFNIKKFFYNKILF